jgi:hypothetical protein
LLHSFRKRILRTIDFSLSIASHVSCCFLVLRMFAHQSVFYWV